MSSSTNLVTSLQSSENAKTVPNGKTAKQKNETTINVRMSPTKHTIKQLFR
jgi:hypothetical protein